MSEFGRRVVLGNPRPLYIDHAADGTAMTSVMAQGRAVGGMTMRTRSDVHTL